MVKLRCSACGYWFAAPAADAENCPDCAIRLRWG
jgi:rubrerythrin